MTRTEKLDKILYALIWVDKMELGNETIDQTITMDFLNENQGFELVDWEKKSLQEQLIKDNYAVEKGGELRITYDGKKFITSGGGYQKIDRVSDQEDIIRTKTIEKFKYDKVAFYLSIVAIIIAVVGLFF